MDIRKPNLGNEMPRFVPRKRTLSRGQYYVLVKWDDGYSSKVGQFCRKSDAEEWIKQNAATWLESRNDNWRGVNTEVSRQTAEPV